jgi:hypothetical protein
MKKGIGCCAGIALVLLLLGALLLLVGLPTALEYLASLQVETVVDLQVGEAYSFGDWHLVLTGSQGTAAGFVILETGETFALSFDELHALPGGYVIRLLAIQDDAVRIQWFTPVTEE